MQNRHVQHVRHNEHSEELQPVRRAHSQIAALFNELGECVGPAVAAFVSGVDALSEQCERADNRREAQHDCAEEYA